MNVQNLGVKYLCVIVLVLLAIWAIYPPNEKLKPGIDLAGGHSLLYEIDDTGLDPSQTQQLAERMIRQLRRRVDPNDQRNLVWRPIGNTRIQIQMPASTGEAQKRRQEKDEAINNLLKQNVSRSAIEDALRRPQGERLPALLELNNGVALRVPLYENLAEKYDTYRRVKDGEEIEGLDEISAFKEYQDALQSVLDTYLSEERLVDVLDLEKKRAERLELLKQRFPEYAEGIDTVVEVYDRWAEQRGLLEGPEDLKRLLRGAGVLEFRILAQRDPSNPSRIDSRNPAYKEQISDYVEQLHERGPRPRPGQAFRWFEIQDPVDFLNVDSAEQVDERLKSERTYIIEKFEADGNYYLLAFDAPEMGLLATAESKWKLVNAFATRDFETGQLVVSFRLDSRGGDQFRRLTKANIDKLLGIFLDDEAISAATIQGVIGERGQISGQFSQQDIGYLVDTLEAGSLPARLKEPPLSERSIGSSLGQTNRDRGFQAAVWGLILVAVFMLVYYLFCGLVANVALAFNVLLVLAAMAVLEATFTLPGIAGLILTVGMAVDANVLIFERIREETARGASLKMAIKAGYEKALSTILDANLTTLITCIILGYAGSEEVKGFAIVLGLGVVFSMFSALFVTRIIFAALVQKGLIKSLPMLRIVGVLNIDWLKMRRIFWPVSLVVVFAGAGLYLHDHARRKANIYDIEFLGGTAVTIQLKPGVTMEDVEVRERITGSGPNDVNPETAAGWLRHVANEIPSFGVTSAAQQGVFEISHPQFNSDELSMVVMAGMSEHIEAVSQGGIERLGPHRIQVTTKTIREEDEEQQAEETVTMEQTRFRDLLDQTGRYLSAAAGRLASARVVASWDSPTGRQQQEAIRSFDINTTETDKEVVRQAILEALGENLKVQRPVEFVLRTDPDRAPHGYHPIYKRDESKSLADLHLGDIIGGDTTADLGGYYGGVAIVFDEVDPPQTEEDVLDRLHSASLLPQFSHKFLRPKIIGLESASGDKALPMEQRRWSSFALLAIDEDARYDDDPRVWEEDLAKVQLLQAQEALRTEKSLQRVIQFAPQIAAQTTQRALMAILLALVGIVIYIWFRFGSMRFGLAAIVALVHDVTISLGAIAASYYIYDALGPNVLLIEDFKIDLSMIAAFLTIVGYSLNDTIVLFDRIRENRGKLKEITPQIVNTSINQTLSRTILTSLTTLVAVGVMYVAGGDGIHGFSFAMILGVVVGSYSSIAIATPLLLHPTLLKWVIHVVVVAILSGLALTLDRREFQVLAWSIMVVFLIVVFFAEYRRMQVLKPKLA